MAEKPKVKPKTKSKPNKSKSIAPKSNYSMAKATYMPLNWRSIELLET